MALTKRFLHADTKQFKPTAKQFVLGIVLGIMFALTLYALMCYFREILRVIWSDNIYRDVSIYSRKEINFYNIILAYIATIFGQSLVFTFWFNRPRHKYGKYGFKLDSLINDLWPLNLVFIGILSSIVVRIGLPFFWRAAYDFGLYPEFNVYFILMIIVLFLQQWITIVRMFKRKGLKYMLISAVIVSALSLILSRMDFINYDTLNMG